MFGGKLEAGSGNITDELWQFDTRSRSWSLRTPSPLLQSQHFAVEGHTAHIVDNRNGEPIMVVLFGYSPIYSYLSHVQEYNIRECQYGTVIEKIFCELMVQSSHVRKIVFTHLRNV